ncbi:venom serine carboxypeptidase-like [Culicoides brevitarsis]|uniref:venom serine carboxypeptidase-like n=1 Tax=Culicoides brevitarsis TaxID=469753 RepID=UPI00307BD95A
MQNYTIFLLFCFAFIQLCVAQLFYDGNLPQWKTRKLSVKGAGKPLILTSHIEEGNDRKARQLSRVDKKLFLNVTSYSGYLTVDKEHNSNLFFWFFPAEGTEHLYDEDEFAEYDYEEWDKKKQKKKKSRQESDPDWENENKPLVLWLQGGPGASSLFGLFVENGPFFVNEDLVSIRKNPFSWHKNYSMLFIDNPVGAGFSFTDEDGYTQNVTQVAKHLHIGLTQFLKMFPWLQNVPFFIAGESYAGKYIPAIGYEIYEQNKIDDGKEFKINLKGLAIGNGFSDPYNMMYYSQFAFQTGLIDQHARNEMRVFEILAQENISNAKGKVFWDLALYTFLKHSRYGNVYNILHPEVYKLDSYLTFVDQAHIRKALHIGNQEFAPPTAVYYNLLEDFMDSAMPWVEKLLDQGLRIMFYSGNLDFIVAYPVSENAYYHMNWKGREEYRQARRLSFLVDGKLAGYVKRARNVFIEAVILNAGHMVPTDQPKVCLELIDDFIHKRI